ncbi:MAG: SMI1/KNR4 family protein [Pirellulaceae bacterium]|nr:SMI1/KNR4 family protein [Pirellulaceae bacterium]
MPTPLSDAGTREERWTAISEFSHHYLRPFGQRDEVGGEEIARAQERLGREFPAALVEFYLRFGNAKDI